MSELPKHLQVQDHKHLLRETSSKAIINNDAKGLQKAKEAKRQRELAKAEEEEMRASINTLKQEMKEVKDLLHTLIQTLANGTSNSS